MTKEAQPWFAPTGENFDFGSFTMLKTACFSYKNQVSQALYLREFLETYDDKVIILRHEEQPNSQGSRKRKKIV